jgi:hypothetical protein
MKRSILLTLVLLITASFALAEGKEEPFLEFAKGNYWKFDVEKRGNKNSGKMEVTEVAEGGKIKVKLTDMRGPMGNEINMEMSGGYLIWQMEEQRATFRWKVLKFSAKKDDSWESDITEFDEKMVLTSKVTAVEDVKTPAGTIKGCLKIENYPSAEPDSKVIMWWAKGVGLVRLEQTRRGEVRESWTLTAFKVGPDISDEKLKEMVEKAEVIALVSVPSEVEKSEAVQARLTGTYKGEVAAQDGKMEITQPGKDSKVKQLTEGDYIVFLKKEGEKLALLYDAVRLQKELTDRLTKLLKPNEKADDALGKLCEKAQIIAAGEIVKLEDRGTFKYYVVKVVSAVKGAEEGKHLDVLCPEGLDLKEGEKYIVFLEATEQSGRKMMKLVDLVSGAVELKEDLLKKVTELVKGSK